MEKVTFFRNNNNYLIYFFKLFFSNDIDIDLFLKNI